MQIHQHEDETWGIDTTKPYTAEDVVSAIIRCFTEAHCGEIERTIQSLDVRMTADEQTYLARRNTEEIVKESFRKNGDDHTKPTKESLLRAINTLRDVARDFREQDVIARHYVTIQSLIDGLAK